MKTAEKTTPELIIAGGEMGERIRNFDWSTTPLGDPASWSQSLKTSISICLNSNFPIALYWGKDLTLIYNDAWSPIPGKKHPWALGQPAKKVWPDIWNDIEPQFIKAFNGEPGGSTDALLPMQRHGYIEECYFDFTFTPVHGESGKIEGIFNAVIETTYRILNESRSNFLNELTFFLTPAKTKEEVFAKLESFFRKNNKQVPFAFICAERNGQFDLIGSTHDAITGSILKKPFPFDKLTSSEGIIFIDDLGEYLTEIPKGYWPEEPKEAVMIPLVDSGGKLTEVIVCGINARRRYDEAFEAFFASVSNIISKTLNVLTTLAEERKRAEAFAEIDKAKTLFFSNISHEFRTPITLMLGPLEELLNRAAVHFDNSDRQNLEVTHRNSLRLLKLVNSLLDFSRIESGRHKATYVLTDICTYTKSLASNFRSVIEKAGLQFEVDTDAFIQPLYIDREMWEKIVFNLLSNAFKYTLSGKITISLSVDGDNALLTVEDTGVGIPESELPRMFERFHRVQSNAGRTYEGTGIGLSLIKELVQLHSGTISVESEEGKGSRFKVSIPFGKDHLPLNQVQETDNGLNDIISDAYVEEAVTLLGSNPDAGEPQTIRY
jgi:signal transduction histidine kinase